jgi:hypothetical protein
MRRLAATIAPACCLGLVACGSHGVSPPNLDVTPAPAAVTPYEEPGGDVTFSYPGNWLPQPRAAPGVVTVSTGSASLTIWAYRTVAVVPNEAAAAAARDRFVTSLTRRDPQFVLTSTGLITVFEAPAFEIRGTTSIDGHPTEVRSVHIFRGLAEYVVDMLSDPDQFATTNTEVFQPLLETLHFFGRPAAAAAQAAAPASPTAPPS